MKKVLITGGAGFIGSELVNQLYDLGEYEITVLDCMTEQIHGSNWHNSYLYNKIKDKCNFIYGDVRDYDVVAGMFPFVSHNSDMRLCCLVYESA